MQEQVTDAMRTLWKTQIEDLAAKNALVAQRDAFVRMASSGKVPANKLDGFNEMLEMIKAACRERNLY